MPATVEALLIAIVFVMPGFILVRTREWFVPPVAKSDVVSLTLTSITVSLAFVPLWLAAAPDRSYSLSAQVYLRPLPTGRTGIQNLGADCCRDSASLLPAVASARISGTDCG